MKRTREATKPNEQMAAAPWRATSWLLGDAVLFAFALYKGMEYSLLKVDGVVSTGVLAAVLVLVFAALAGLRWGHVRRYGGRLFPGLALEAITAGAIMLLAAKLSLVQGKGQSFSWLPLEWHKLLDNHLLLVKVTPWFALLLSALTALTVYNMVRGRRLILVPALAALIALTYFQCLLMAKQGTLGVYLVMYVAPVGVTLAAAGANRPRLGARAAIISAASLILLWHYIGWMPVIFNRSFLHAPGVRKIYPEAGRKPDFPLAFIRDFEVDPKRSFLFTAYGPTSGMVRINLMTGEATVKETTAELVRYISLVPEQREFFALDWMNSDMLTVSMDTMQVLKRENVYFGIRNLYVPVFYIVKGNKMYATYSERPGIAEFTLRPLKLNRWINLRDEGVTKFRSGVWKATIDPVKNKLYAEVGMTDIRDKFLIIRVDLETFKVDGRAELPEGGMELTGIPSKRRLIAASFFSRKFYEFDMDTMAQVRTFTGPISCRNLLYDAKRDMLIGTGFLDGELRFIDYESGKTIKRSRVGNKAASLFLTPENDFLYLGSSWGIFSVNIEEFLSGAGK